ncbi:hypothetical protein [Streptomyces sp. NPDC058424]|uniref:hypothetical protein n=1 Tax=Streptomyces sp. NPDC058424 TaxID=3346491 RepID=UPI00366227A8
MEAALSRAATAPGPHFVVADVEPEDVRTAGSSQAYPFDIVEAAVVFRRALEDRGLVPPSGRLKCSVHALSDDSALPKNPEFSEVIASYCV